MFEVALALVEEAAVELGGGSGVSGFEPIGGDVEWQGAIIAAGVERYRHADGEVVTREKVWHPGAVGILALDDEHVWLTRQPREAAGLTRLAGDPRRQARRARRAAAQTAQRELAEEIGKRADSWNELSAFYTSPGFSDERVWLYLATGLSRRRRRRAPEPDERIEVVRGRLTGSTTRSRSARTRSR